MGSYRRASGMGIELQKQWMAALDSRTRDSHRELDGEKADIDGRFSNGLSYPGDPTGPASEVWNCRCTMVAALPGHDVLRDRNTSKLETSYEEWKAGRDPKKPKPSGRTLKEFMDTPAAERAAKKAGVSKAQLRKRIVAKLGADGKTGRDFLSMTRAEQQEVLKEAVELTRKQDKPRRNVRVVNDALYNSQKNYVERHGGVVKRDAEAEEHLDKLGAGASSLDDAVLLRPDASTSEVLEEVFHFKQNLRGDYSDAPVDEMVARRETDAQKFLLSVAERSNIPILETELTKRNLARYESDLREILEQRRSGHESE